MTWINIVEERDRYDSLFVYYGNKKGIDWRLLKCQVSAESAFDPDAESRVGAKGLAQFMDRTWKEWHDGTPGIQEAPPDNKLIDPRDPEDVVKAQVAYIDWLFRFMGVSTRQVFNPCAISSDHVRRQGLTKVLAAYNWGPGRVKKAVRKYGHDFMRHTPRETQNYVKKILTDYAKHCATPETKEA